MEFSANGILIILCLGVLLGNVQSQSANLRMDFRTDDRANIWADGAHLGQFENVFVAHDVEFPATTEVLAFKLEDTHGIIAAFIASISNGVLTNDDGDWKCTSSEPAGNAWKLSGFDDTTWDAPIVVGQNGDSPWFNIPGDGVSPDAEWIWLPNWWTHRTIYCRIALDNTDDCTGVTCNNNGNCIDGDNTYTCDCQAPWTGDNCDEVETYNCDDNSPCGSPLLTAGLYYYPADSSAHFIQCDPWGGCYVMPCAPGTVWSQAAMTCIWA